MLLIIHVKPPEGLFAYLQLLLFAEHLIALEGGGETD